MSKSLTMCASVLGRRLNVQGRRAELIELCSAEVDRRPGTSSSSSQEKPTVIEVEGLMEEYLAFDSRDLWVTCVLYLLSVYWLYLLDGFTFTCLYQGRWVWARLFRVWAKASLFAPHLSVPVPPSSCPRSSVWRRVAAAGRLDERAGSAPLGMLHLE